MVHSTQENATETRTRTHSLVDVNAILLVLHADTQVTQLEKSIALPAKTQTSKSLQSSETELEDVSQKHHKKKRKNQPRVKLQLTNNASNQRVKQSQDVNATNHVELVDT